MKLGQLGQKIRQYQETLKQYIDCPESRRLFINIFTESLDLVRNYGGGFQFLTFGTKRFEYVSPNTKGKLAYKGITLLKDQLNIQYQRWDPEDLDHRPYIISEGVDITLERLCGYEYYIDKKNNRINDNSVPDRKRIFEMNARRVIMTDPSGTIVYSHEF